MDTSELKKKSAPRVFGTWLEDWKKPLIKHNDCISKARLLQKYKNLIFKDPDHEGVTWTVFGGHLEYQSRRAGGWYVIAEQLEDSNKDEPFFVNDMLIGMIADTEQAEGVPVVRRDAVATSVGH